MRALFTTQPGHGHLNPMLPYALALRDAGHEVRFATAPSFCATVGRLGFPVSPVGHDFTWERAVDFFPEMATAATEGPLQVNELSQRIVWELASHERRASGYWKRERVCLLEPLGFSVEATCAQGPRPDTAGAGGHGSGVLAAVGVLTSAHISCDARPAPVQALGACPDAVRASAHDRVLVGHPSGQRVIRAAGGLPPGVAALSHRSPPPALARVCGPRLRRRTRGGRGAALSPARAQPAARARRAPSPPAGWRARARRDAGARGGRRGSHRAALAASRAGEGRLRCLSPGARVRALAA